MMEIGIDFGNNEIATQPITVQEYIMTNASSSQRRPVSFDIEYPNGKRQQISGGGERVKSPVIPMQKDCRFFRAGNRSGLPVLSLRQVISPSDSQIPGAHSPGGGHGLSSIIESPKWLIENSKHKPRDFAGDPSFGTMIWSKRLLDVVLTIDPDAVEYKPFIYEYLDGTTPGEDYFVVDVVRIINAVDYANSIYDIYPDLEDGRPKVMNVAAAAFDPSIPESFHLFRDKNWPRSIYVSNVLRKSIEKAKPKISGIEFYDVAAQPYTIYYFQ
jgi:hypothetical protein